MFYYQRNMSKSIEETYLEIDRIIENSGYKYDGYWELRYTIIKWINKEKSYLQGVFNEYGVIWATGTSEEFSVCVRSDGISINNYQSADMTPGEASSLMKLLNGLKVDFLYDDDFGEYTDITFTLKSSTTK